MLSYEISDKARESFAPHHRIVQGAISVLANRSLGVRAEPSGIGDYRGGVIVNTQEVVIHRDRVVGGGVRDGDEPSPEERAVVGAISEIARLWEQGEFSPLLSYVYLGMGDPLRAMLGVR